MPHCLSNAPRKNSSTKQKGMTFIEVLIALVIMVTGILGAVAMQATAKKGSFDAMQRSLASSLAQDIIGRIRSNDITVLASYARTDYGTTLDPVPAARCNTNAALCTFAQMATNDRYEWERALMGADVIDGTNNVGGLVDALACISVIGSAVSVVITWQGRTETVTGSTQGCGGTDDQRRQVLVDAFVI